MISVESCVDRVNHLHGRLMGEPELSSPQSSIAVGIVLFYLLPKSSNLDPKIPRHGSALPLWKIVGNIGAFALRTKAMRQPC